MKYILSIAFSLLFIIGCGSNKEKTTTTDPGEKSATDVAECFRYINAKDTITLKLIHVGASITGTLVFKFFEKDMNAGTIQGNMRGDLLIANYTFMSEGSLSVRQIVFKKDNDSYIEGYGTVVNNNDRVTFSNIDSLKFDVSKKLTAYKCME